MNYSLQVALQKNSNQKMNDKLEPYGTNNSNWNNCNFDEEKNLSSSYLSNLTKMMLKKLIQDDVNMRYELLKAEKKLLMQMKQTKELERTLRDFKEMAARDRSFFQNEILNRSSSMIRKRSSLFRNNFNYLNMEYNLFTYDEENKKNNTEIQWNLLETHVNRLKDIHLKEIISIHGHINNPEKMINQIEESNITFIELYHEVQKEIVKLKHEDLLRLIKLQKLTLNKKLDNQPNNGKTT